MRTALVTLGAVLVAALFAAWFFTTYEKVLTEVPATYQGEARINRFFAAEMLLRTLGFEVDSRASLTPSEWLPQRSDTLFMRSSATFASSDELEHLTAWVRSGGHLVLLAPEQPTLATEAVFEHFGYRLTGNDLLPRTDTPAETDTPTEGEAAVKAEAAAEAEKHVLTSGPSAGTEAAYTIADAGLLRSLEIAAEDFDGATLVGEQGTVAARRTWGDGVVTVIAGSLLFENPLLADSDHARLLLDVVAGYIEPGKVWFVYDAVFPPLWQIIWSNFPYAVTGMALTALLWLGSAMPRFGPELTPAPAARRSIVEHIAAAGRFVWRYGGAGTLVASSSAAVLRRAESTHPGIARLPSSEQAALISGMTGRSAAAVLAALELRGEMGQREFTHGIRTLQTVRNRL